MVGKGGGSGAIFRRSCSPNSVTDDCVHVWILFVSDPCGMQSPELRAEQGRERNGKVIRNGG